MIQIEKDIPIPDNLGATKTRSPYPFGSMGVGDSIFVKGDEKAKSNAVAAMRRFQKAHEGTTFVFGDTGDGVRIWRKS